MAQNLTQQFKSYIASTNLMCYKKSIFLYLNIVPHSVKCWIQYLPAFELIQMIPEMSTAQVLLSIPYKNLNFSHSNSITKDILNFAIYSEIKSFIIIITTLLDSKDILIIIIYQDQTQYEFERIIKFK